MKAPPLWIGNTCLLIGSAFVILGCLNNRETLKLIRQQRQEFELARKLDPSLGPSPNWISKTIQEVRSMAEENNSNANDCIEQVNILMVRLKEATDRQDLIDCWLTNDTQLHRDAATELIDRRSGNVISDVKVGGEAGTNDTMQITSTNSDFAVLDFGSRPILTFPTDQWHALTPYEPVVTGPNAGIWNIEFKKP